MEASIKDGEDLFDAQLNARLVADAEQYYRIMYYGSDESWNHRDTHMFETLRLLLDRYGDGAKAVVWEHNSHLGNAAATQFGKHGQINVGQLCRQAFGNDVYAIGQGTDHGTVAAASDWEGAMEIKHVRPAHPDSYERLMHLAEMDAFFSAAFKIAKSTVDVSAGRAAIGTGDWRGLSPGNGATEPLLRCLTSQPVRRMDLVRRDFGGPPAHDATVRRARTTASVCSYRPLRVQWTDSGVPDAVRWMHRTVVVTARQ